MHGKTFPTQHHFRCYRPLRTFTLSTAGRDPSPHPGPFGTPVELVGGPVVPAAMLIRRADGYPTPMSNELSGKRIAFLVAPEGTEQVELTTPWGAVEQAGGTPELVSTEVGKIQAFNHLTPADTFEADKAADDVSARPTTTHLCCRAGWRTPGLPTHQARGGRFRQGLLRGR